MFAMLYACFIFARCLLDVCWTFARCLLDVCSTVYTGYKPHIGFFEYAIDLRTANSSHQTDNQRMLRAFSGDGNVSTMSASS